MANIEFTLSSRESRNGKRQLLVRIASGRTIRFRIKSNVYVSPEFWDSKSQSVKVPIKRTTNADRVLMAKEERDVYECFLRDINDIIDASKESGEELSKEWIEDAFNIKPIIEDHSLRLPRTKSGGYFSASNIEKAKKYVEERNLALIQEEARVKKETKLYDLIPAYCQAHNLSASRIKVYKVLGRLLARYECYMKIRDRKYRLQPSQLTSDDIENFRIYMKDEGNIIASHPQLFKEILKAYPQTENTNQKERKIANRGDNYVVVTMKRLKALIHWCLETNRMTTNPFDGVEVGSEIYGRPIYISKEERNIIADFDLSSCSIKIQQQRDIFIFQCLIGCRVSDLYSFTKNNIVGGNLIYSPQKTKKESCNGVSIPLSEKAKALIQKYEGNDDNNGRLFPFIAEQRYNDAIKEIFKECGITRMVTWRNPTTGNDEQRPINEIASSHMARRTFVGVLYKQWKDPTLIGSLSGHAEGSKAFARYRDIDNDTKKDVIKTLD